VINQERLGGVVEKGHQTGCQDENRKRNNRAKTKRRLKAKGKADLPNCQDGTWGKKKKREGKKERAKAGKRRNLGRKGRSDLKTEGSARWSVKGRKLQKKKEKKDRMSRM